MTDLTTDIAELTAASAAHQETLINKADEITQAALTAIGGAQVSARSVYVDPIDGSNGNNGSNWDNAVQTLDQAIELGAKNQELRIFLCANNTLAQKHFVSLRSILIYGMDKNGEDKDVSIYLTIEANNSPLSSGKRTTPGIYAVGDIALTFSNVSIVMNDVPATIDQSYFVTSESGVSVCWNNGTIGCNSAESNFVLLTSWTCSPISFFAAGLTIGGNAVGKIISGVGAGANPNDNLRFRSNLTSL